MAIENEISYSVNLSQDLLYIILDSYISKTFSVVDEYHDFVDENNVRSRLSRGAFSSVLKTCTSLRKMVYVQGDTLVPFVDRHSVESVADAPTANLRRIVKCRVYQNPERPECEIKFEHIYKNKNLIDKFDSLMATKQIMLWNLLQNKNENLVKESHLGSDEIMAAIRLEYEYVDAIDDKVLSFMADIVRRVDAIAAAHNINPLLPYTTLQNNIIYRKFEDEKLIYALENVAEVHKWALKLDGVRGKGFFTRSFVIVFMDDMQIFSGTFPTLFAVNNVVAFQCELVGSVMYITDILHVFKYGYNNRTQYEVSMDPYDVAPACALECINHLADAHNDNVAGLRLSTFNGGSISVKFQRFFDPPVAAGGYTSVPTDGFVVLDTAMRYVKYKQVKTVEVEYDADARVFKTLEGPLPDHSLDLAPTLGPLVHQAIYEAVIRDRHVSILKARPDRLVPN
ncbi:lef-4 [Peridroma alphabaculovirus]|uniref:Lef-4 n=1 Tax=Peridroma alphabaculovirus TaxID=1346829 RepID=A0A068LRI8_9ABAC|nr:lef-4 [Peridroma alphabaculovirus]AIE47800.1 lef-4 [Peridroma alphabaculovirus]